ncbi:TlpA disulfide reductase family protein [Acinetobacter sp. P8-3-8]|uniref:TlpA disulfide reductase family protein n=1 Tax=Acinetobacter sp. P8-3-8 TaxID=1029823 RepID=UPI0002485CE5|nr:TlpA disulfide reductase family protein [Acinetobacter sp. P8-3-8]
MITAQAIHLGPIMLPWGLMILMVAIGVALLFGQYSPYGYRRFKVCDSQWTVFKDTIWTAILIGLLCARIGFVLLNLDAYLQHPIEIIKIQDKGFNFYLGLLAASLWIFWKNRAIKRRFLIILLSIFTTITLLGTAIHKQVLLQYQQFPKVSLTSLQQQKVELVQFIGKPTVINLWASWCPPCRREMPVLDQAQKTYPNVQFVFINQFEDAATVHAYLQQHTLKLRWVLLDPHGSTAQKTAMYGLPSTLFFNAQGQLVDSHMGEITHAALDHYVQKIISD